MTGHCPNNDWPQSAINREADLIAKCAVYHAIQLVKKTDSGHIRPKIKDNMDRWLRGRK